MSMPTVTFGPPSPGGAAVSMLQGVDLCGAFVSARAGTLGVAAPGAPGRTSNDDGRTAVVRTHPRFVARLVRD